MWFSFCKHHSHVNINSIFHNVWATNDSMNHNQCLFLLIMIKMGNWQLSIFKSEKFLLYHQVIKLLTLSSLIFFGFFFFNQSFLFWIFVYSTTSIFIWNYNVFTMMISIETRRRIMHTWFLFNKRIYDGRRDRRLNAKVFPQATHAKHIRRSKKVLNSLLHDYWKISR